VNFEEQMRGWLSLVARAGKSGQEVAAYTRLQSMLRFFSAIPVLDYTEVASEQFAALRRLRPRTGSMDLKIAAITLSLNATLLSRNIKDFRLVPNLKVEDWIK
jgi:tRNA(fMet)-specific endonuclease VapC